MKKKGVHMLTGPFAHDSSVAVAPSSSLRSERITDAYLVHSVHPNPRYARTSDMRQPLYEIALRKIRM